MLGLLATSPSLADDWATVEESDECRYSCGTDFASSFSLRSVTVGIFFSGVDSPPLPEEVCCKFKVDDVLLRVGGLGGAVGSLFLRTAVWGSDAALMVLCKAPTFRGLIGSRPEERFGEDLARCFLGFAIGFQPVCCCSDVPEPSSSSVLASGFFSAVDVL